MKQTGERKSQPLLNRRHQQQMLARAVQLSLITGGVLAIHERLKHVVKRSMLSSLVQGHCSSVWPSAIVNDDSSKIPAQ